ncbi:MAG: circadian clock protein KaiB [Gammaproteobacteria bacterium]|nr:MAG: circadian clock protein KaiB [Gammaproteobacteria bacterium]
MDAPKFKLYVTGVTPRSRRAVSALRAFCKAHWGDDFELAIVDILQDPSRAGDDGVLATPTLVKVAPEPSIRMIGDMSDSKALVKALGLAPTGAEDAE